MITFSGLSACKTQVSFDIIAYALLIETVMSFGYLGFSVISLAIYQSPFHLFSLFDFKLLGCHRAPSWPFSSFSGSLGDFFFGGRPQFSCSVVSDSLRPHELQHARPPCPSPTPRVHPDSCPSSQ